MLAPSFSLSFTKVTDLTASSLNPSSSFSSSSIEHLALSSINFPIKATKPTTSKLKPHHYFVKPAPFSLLSRSLFVCASAAFEGFEETEALEEETATPDEDQQQEEAEENGMASASESTEGRRLYVGNLPYSMTSSQLADVFSECGRVVSVEIVYDRVTDRSRGFAFVTMGSFEEAKEAIRLFDGSQIGGRTAKVNFPEVPRGGEREVMEPKIRSSYQGFVDSPHKIYAGNLHWGLTSQYLREAFQDQPGYLSARIVYDRDTRKSRGFGFVSFDSAEHVNSAISAMNGVELEGRPLRLNLAQQRSSQSPPPGIETKSESESWSG